MGQTLDTPARTSAENVISSLRINLMEPKTEVLNEPGPQFKSLSANIDTIKNDLSNKLLEADPKLVYRYKLFYRCAIIIGLLIFISMIIGVALGQILVFIVLFVLLAVFTICMFFIRRYLLSETIKWKNKVLLEITNYCKNNFLKKYSQEQFQIHLLYPVYQYQTGKARLGRPRRMIKIAEWIVIRITIGNLQQPINESIYWSSTPDPVKPVIIVQQQQQQIIIDGTQPKLPMYNPEYIEQQQQEELQQEEFVETQGLLSN